MAKEKHCYRYVGSGITRTVGPEGTNGAGHKDAQFVLFGQLDDIVDTLDVDSRNRMAKKLYIWLSGGQDSTSPHGQWHILLTHRTKQRREMD